MAEDTCISVEFQDDSVWNYCWEDGHPDPSWKSVDVTTGLRPSQGTTARSWRTCQYYLQGMSATCTWWKEGTPNDEEGTTTSGSFFCSFITENTSDNLQDPPAETPTGFNNNKCDFLGRRQWCSKYEGSKEDDLDEWICAAPNPYLTGVGEKSMDNEAAIFTSVDRKDILGYNDKYDGTGTGQCDCYGMGRGADGCKVVGTDSATEKSLSKLPIVCNFYRPYQMGFGVIEPSKKQRGDVEADGITITDQGWDRAKAWEDSIEYRLPLNYVLYNWRAKFQKCQWWNEDSGRAFTITASGTLYLEGGDSIFNNTTGRVNFCDCTDSAADGYNTRVWETQHGAGQLARVWAQKGGAVCNGARPECPCYSGKWEYLSGEKMWPGMPVTANQILELRFWSQDWDNQDDYDVYYTQKPNFEDADTPAIYTFTKWKRPEAGIDYEDSKMKGKKLTLCQPAPFHQKEFTVDYIKSEDLVYHHEEIGTPTDNTQRHFPTLIRDPSFPELKPLSVIYPYYNDDTFDAEICKQQGPAGHIKRHNNIYGDAVKTVGYTIRDKKIYVINTSKILIDNGAIKEFSGVYNIKPSKNSTRTVESMKNDVYNTLREAVSRGLEEHPDYIKEATSDEVFGYFLIDSVKLKYNENNLLLICVDFGDGTWEYRRRQVYNLWCGGVIKQRDYTHEYGSSESGYNNTQPTSISPTAEATASTNPLGGASENVDVYSTFSLDDVVAGRRYFSYSVQEIINRDSPQIFWGAVGNTNKIWLELNDININYVYDWDIESAEFRVIVEDVEDDQGNITEKPARGEDPELVIELKKVLLDDNHIPPNACLLEPVDPEVRIRFLNSEWELYVTYKYKQLTDKNLEDYDDEEDVEYDIVHGAYKDEASMYKSSYEIEYSNNLISIEEISAGSIQIMAHFKDINKRIISAFATKLLTNIVRESCRSVDIFYSYKAQGRVYNLTPYRGFCINIAADLPQSDPVMHIEIPACGDHNYSPWQHPGPMWFPFDSCRGYDMYDEFTVCNNCQAGYVGPMNDGVQYDSNGNKVFAGGQVLKRKDYRYCGPHKYQAFGEGRGNWAAACNCGCAFSYSNASSSTVVFTGYGRIMAPVDLSYYELRQWAPPPFGNEGRELVEKFISQDYVNHFIGRPPYQRNEWMPLVLDQSVFFSTFNAYDDNPEDEYMVISEYSNYESFRYTNQLNMGLSAAIDEKIVQEKDEYNESTGVAKRFRWNELFQVHHEGNCSYPLPPYPISTTATKALFYYLKKDWHAWAWQEEWKDIERNIEGDLPETDLDTEDPSDADLVNSEEEVTIDMGKLDFLELTKPLYIVDAHKTEYRRIMDEGKWIVEYRGPRLDEEGYMKYYPFLFFHGNKKTFRKPFEIIYPEDSYTNVSVTWAKEGGATGVGASAAKDNPYEKTSGNEWVHSKDTLFDNTAVSGTEAAAEAGRKVASAIDDITWEVSSSYFNRGLIAGITRDRLYYLPKKETILFYSSSGQGAIEGNFADLMQEISIDTASTGEYPYKDRTLVPGLFVWQEDSVTITSTSEGEWAFISLHIRGTWGYSEGLSLINKPQTHKLIMPAVSLTCSFEDGTSGEPRSQSSTMSEYKEPADGQEVETYDIYLDFMLGPVEMLNKRTTEFNINFSGTTDSFISIDEIELVKADYIDIRYEHINVWERKYIASEFTDKSGQGINLDGVGDYLHYQPDLNNSGQYFRFRSPRFGDTEVVALDKIKTVSCGRYYLENESLPDMSFSNLKEIEKTEQKDLYEYAYGLDVSEDVVVYAVTEPYKYQLFLDDLGIRFSVGDLEIASERLTWKKHYLSKQLKQYEFWRPGGHFYRWTEHFTRQKCSLFGSPQNVFSGYYAHVDHQGIGTPLEVNASKPIDPGNSYYSLRFYVMQAKYDRAMILGGGDPEYNDRMSGVTSYNAGTFVGGGRLLVDDLDLDDPD